MFQTISVVPEHLLSRQIKASRWREQVRAANEPDMRRMSQRQADCSRVLHEIKKRKLDPIVRLRANRPHDRPVRIGLIHAEGGRMRGVEAEGLHARSGHVEPSVWP